MDQPQSESSVQERGKSATQLFYSLVAGEVVFSNEQSYLRLASDLYESRSYNECVECFKLFVKIESCSPQLIQRYSKALYMIGLYEECHAVTSKLIRESSNITAFQCISVFTYSALQTNKSATSFHTLVNQFHKDRSVVFLIYAYFICVEDKTLESHSFTVKRDLIEQLSRGNEANLRKALNIALSIHLFELVEEVCNSVVLDKKLETLYFHFMALVYHKTHQNLKAHIFSIRSLSLTDIHNISDYHSSLMQAGRQIPKIIETHFGSISNYCKFIFPILSTHEKNFLITAARFSEGIDLIAFGLDKAFSSFISSSFEIDFFEDISLCRYSYVFNNLTSAPDALSVDRFLAENSTLFLQRTLSSFSSSSRLMPGNINSQYFSRLSDIAKKRSGLLSPNSMSFSDELNSFSFRVDYHRDQILSSLTHPQSIYTKINHRYWELLSLALQEQPTVPFNSRLPLEEFAHNGFTKALRDLFCSTSAISDDRLSIIPTGISLRVGTKSFSDEYHELSTLNHHYPGNRAKQRVISALDVFSTELNDTIKTPVIYSDSFDFYELYSSGQIKDLILDRAASAHSVFIVKEKSDTDPFLINIPPSKHSHIYVSSRDVHYDWMHTLNYTSGLILNNLRIGTPLVVLVSAGAFSTILGKYIGLQCHLLSIKTPFLYIDLGNIMKPSRQAAMALDLQFLKKGLVGYSKHRDSPLTPNLFTYPGKV